MKPTSWPRDSGAAAIDFFYFSAESYSTLGYSDVVPMDVVHTTTAPVSAMGEVAARHSGFSIQYQWTCRLALYAREVVNVVLAQIRFDHLYSDALHVGTKSTEHRAAALSPTPASVAVPPKFALEPLLHLPRD